MARPSKIEKYGLADKVIKLRNNDKTYNDIVNIVMKEDIVVYFNVIFFHNNINDKTYNDIVIS